MPGWYFAHVQDDLNLCILHMSKGTFLLYTAKQRLNITIEFEEYTVITLKGQGKTGKECTRDERSLQTMHFDANLTKNR